MRIDNKSKPKNQDQVSKADHIWRRPSLISQNPKDPQRLRHWGVVFVQSIPKTTKDRFKIACAMTWRTGASGRRGESMRDAIIKLMRFYVKHSGVPDIPVADPPSGPK